MWISVHDKIDGAKLRKLAKTAGCSKSEAVGVLVLLWLWGLQNADKSGYLPYCDRHDLEKELSGALSDGLSQEKVVTALIETEWVDQYDSGLYIHDWYDWQKQWYRYQEKKEADRARKRKKNSIKDDNPFKDWS